MDSVDLSIYRPAKHSSIFIDAKKVIERRSTWIAVISIIVLGLAYVFTNGNVIVPLIPFILVTLVIAIWCKPEIILPITMVGACMIETLGYDFKDSFTDRIPLFQDLNTVFQVYAHVNFHALPVSLYELMLIMAISFGTIRAVFDKTFSLKGSILITPICIYMVCVAAGIVVGVATGGDYKLASFEVRAQFYMVVAYLMAVNAKIDPKEAALRFFRTMAICIGIKGLLLTFRFLVTLGGQTIPEIGVGAHEESFFFDMFVILWVALKLADIEPQTRRILLFFMPFVIIANLANQRRAATAAMMIGIPVLFYLSYMSFPHRRKLIAGVVAGLAAVAAIYLPLFWNGSGMLAQPARAVKSQFTPDARDQSSDEYRLAEDANLMYTMRTSPIVGFGYGKPIYNIAGMVDLTAIDPLIMYLTHDQILWVWMRLGIIGFVVFWVMICALIIRMTQTAKDQSFDITERTVAVYSCVVVVALLMFALYDLQLSNVRDILFSFLLFGIFARIVQERPAKVKEPPIRMTTVNGLSIDDPRLSRSMMRVKTGRPDR